MYLPGCALFLSFCTVFSTVKSQDDNLTVQLPAGKIRGHLLKSFNGNDYYAFQEIPYAAPPVGELRYKEPRNSDPWSGILNTTENTKQCMQGTMRSHRISLTETEDCLYLNVYSPNKPGSEDLLPTLIFVHGGGFVGGSGVFDMNNPKRFMDYGIIVVTINYRLGPFGFISSMDGVIPGNLALKDQRFAFKWVKSHIQLFGGDPEKITISGESAGSFSIGFQLLGQNSEGLFRAAIQESGSPVCQSAYTTYARTYAFELGKYLDETCTSDDSEDLLKLLLNATAEDIITAASKVTPRDPNVDGYLTSNVWFPVLETEDEPEPLITAPMLDSFMNGDFILVPVLLGFNSEEGLGFIDESNSYIASDYDKDPSLMVSKKFNIAEENITTFGKEMKNIYTDSSFAEDAGAFVRYSSDGFTTGMIRQAECSSRYVPVYLYQFSYAGKLGEFFCRNGRITIPGAEAVSHAEELTYLWEYIYDPPMTDSDALMMKRMLTMWTNFVKYLNPTPEKDELLDNVQWPTIQDIDIQFLNINNTLEVRSKPRYYNSVNTLMQNYIRPPYTVY